MSTKQAASLAGTRLYKASKAPAMAMADHRQANCNICALPEASFMSGWYRPGRLMSQSERLQS